MIKRIVDVVAGTALAIAVTPLVLVLAALVAFQFRASPFFVQERLGRNGRTFRIIKLRTLPVTTPRYADKYALRTVTVPSLGRMLRRLHLDELPQLWLVPLGRMSLVGPRPEMPFLNDRLPRHVVEQRLQVRPGCTGLWQVSVHAGGLIEEHPEYDLHYITGQSLRLDAWIVWRTIRKMVGRPHPLTLESLPRWVAPADREQREWATLA